MRRQIGYPFAVFLEGHGWWHIGTGLGAYLILVACEVLMLSIKESPDNFEVRGYAMLPYVKRIKPYRPSSAIKAARKSK